MAAPSFTTICSNVATLTTTSVFPTGSQITTFTDVTSTIPGDIFTTFLSTNICTTFSPSLRTSCSATFIEVETQGQGRETVLREPITIIVDNEATVTSTLFGDVCTTIALKPGDPPVVAPPPVITPNPGTPRPGTPSPGTPTPSPRSPAVTGPSATISSSATPTGTIISDNAGGSKKVSLPPIVGGIIGGVVVLAALLMFAYKMFYKGSGPSFFKSNAKPNKAHFAEPSFADKVDFGANIAHQHALFNQSQNQANFQQQQQQQQQQYQDQQQQQQQQQQTWQQDLLDHDRLPDPLEDALKKRMEDYMAANRRKSQEGHPPPPQGMPGSPSYAQPNAPYSSPPYTPHPQSPPNMSGFPHPHSPPVSPGFVAPNRLSGAPQEPHYPGHMPQGMPYPSADPYRQQQGNNAPGPYPGYSQP